jgi:uncharacterized damage-inducible protein DinB
MELNPYAGFLGQRDPLPVLASTSSRISQLVGDAGEDKLNHRPTPGKWSVREIVAHLADCELVFSFRLQQTLAEDHPTIQPFDQDRWASRYGNRSFATASSLFDAMRAWNLLLIDGATSAERQRLTTHPERGTMTFWTIVETMAGHDINHLQQIERLESVLRDPARFPV